MNPAGPGSAYARRRDWIARYFNERADQWASLTGSEPVGRIRTTVREGRRAIQDAVLGWLPQDLAGVRVLDAGCGPGSFSLRLAERGADVVAVDVSKELTRLARRRAESFDGPGTIDVRVGDMLDFAELGDFDYTVALDSLINYPYDELKSALLVTAASTRRAAIFTVAPKTLLLAAMHTAGKLFPRSNRAPSIEPVRIRSLRRWIDEVPDLDGWSVADQRSVHRGFYISSALHLSREPRLPVPRPQAGTRDRAAPHPPPGADGPTSTMRRQPGERRPDRP